MIHKYYTFAVKRINVIMYNERIDQVSEDLLKEIDEKDQDSKTSTTQANIKSKREKQNVKANKKVDKLKEGNIFMIIFD
jgi:hypothetical protein